MTVAIIIVTWVCWLDVGEGEDTVSSGQFPLTAEGTRHKLASAKHATNESDFWNIFMLKKLFFRIVFCSDLSAFDFLVFIIAHK